MSVATGVLVYVIIWWVVFFIVLPIGVTAQNEGEQGTVQGTPQSAPDNPRIWRKMAITTVVAGVLMALYVAFVLYSGLSLRDLFDGRS